MMTQGERNMLLNTIKTDAATFFAYTQNIDTFDKLAYVLAHMDNSFNLKRQLEAWCDNDMVFNRQFNDDALAHQDAFGVGYTIAEFEEVLDDIAKFIVKEASDTYDDEPNINYRAIFRLAALGVNVQLTFEGAVETREEDETLTNIGVTFDFGDFKLIL
jgi:hypothetical protein